MKLFEAIFTLQCAFLTFRLHYFAPIFSLYKNWCPINNGPHLYGGIYNINKSK